MYHVIVNPTSRSGRGKRIWQKQIEPSLQREKIPYRVYFSQKAGDISKIARELALQAAGAPLSLLLLGGDGTVNELVQELPPGSDVTLGYIPTGSSNDLARDLKIPTSPKKALDLILHTGTPKPMDLGAVLYPDGRKRRFCVSCGLGYDAAVCEEVQRSVLKTLLNRVGLGKLVYLGIALKQLFAARSVSARLTLDGGVPEDLGKILFVTGMNHRFEGGGFLFCPQADWGDGVLDLCVVGNLPRLLVLFALPTAFFGKHYRFHGISSRRASRFVLETDAPLWVHTDGEVTTQAARLEVFCEPDALRILTPGENLKHL